MKFTKFEIKNFKGINELTLDLNKLPNGKIFPLVGLNESGKTTILETIDLLQRGTEDGREHHILHKANSGTFSGDVEIKATLELEKQDKKFIKDFLSEEGFDIQKELDEISIIKKYNFDNSDFKTLNTSWVLPIYVKKKRASNFIKLYDKDNELWNKLVNSVEENLIPKILYFSDFLFKFPEKIYLENISLLTISDDDKLVLEEYRMIIDDVLHSINKNYSLSDFLTKYKALSDPAKQSSASKIKNDISTVLKRRIIDPWEDIFPGTKKSIIIDVKMDNIGVFMELKVDDGGSPFYIHERSLGFRWFFGFILFTEFRKMRDGENGEYLFLFDEPASNLHQSSQIKLLSIFRDLSGSAKIIYSTHSHYLLNIDFLSNAFVVKDEGRTEENDYDYKQDIKAIPYRTFIADTDNDETHVKPILDVLEFVKSPLVPSAPVVFSEGKNDYYTFKWIKETFFADKYSLNFYPGAGVDKYENIFREYLVNGKCFIAVFDDDGDDVNGGIGARKRYLNDVSQELEKHVFTLADVKTGFSGFCTEKLFLSNKTDEKLNIQQVLYPNDTEYNKTHFNKAIEGFLITKSTFTLKKSTLNNFKALFDFMEKKLNELN